MVERHMCQSMCWVLVFEVEIVGALGNPPNKEPYNSLAQLLVNQRLTSKNNLGGFLAVFICL